MDNKRKPDCDAPPAWDCMKKKMKVESHAVGCKSLACLVAPMEAYKTTLRMATARLSAVPTGGSGKLIMLRIVEWDIYEATVCRAFLQLLSALYAEPATSA